MTMMMSVGVVMTSYLEEEGGEQGARGSARTAPGRRQASRSQGRETHSLMMCGCRSTLRYWISRLTRGVMSMLTIFLRLMIFIATLWPVSEWTATVARRWWGGRGEQQARVSAGSPGRRACACEGVGQREGGRGTADVATTGQGRSSCCELDKLLQERLRCPAALLAPSLPLGQSACARGALRAVPSCSGPAAAAACEKATRGEGGTDA